MKGNQGLEALAALCGGRPKVVANAGVLAAAAANANGITTSSLSSSSTTPIPSSVPSAGPTAKAPIPMFVGNGQVHSHGHSNVVEATAAHSQNTLY